jgi:hypothetical protein
MTPPERSEWTVTEASKRQFGAALWPSGMRVLFAVCKPTCPSAMSFGGGFRFGCIIFLGGGSCDRHFLAPPRLNFVSD